MLPTKPTLKPRNNEEHSEQAKLVLLIRNELAPTYPILRWFHSIPNGLFLQGSVASTAINEGLKSGVADLFLPVRNAEYSGLYLEMKSKKGTHKQKQKEFAEFVRSQGFKLVVPRSCDEALKEILDYCGIELTL